MTEDLEQHTCPICGVNYAAPARFFSYRKNLPSGHNNAGWYCPNGHSLIHAESAADKQRRRAERAEQLLAQKDDEIATAEKRVAAAKGQITKLQKRASAGTCPCCNRTFQNLATHMKRQHTEFVTERGAKVIPMKRKRKTA